MSRDDLTDFEWRVIEPLCPTSREACRVSMTGACGTAFSGYCDPARYGAICPSATARAPPATTAFSGDAERGFPRRNDNPIVGAIARAHYPGLARAGVRIFEFRGGLLHAKTLIADGSLGLVGAANKDRRRLDLNFENNILFDSADLAAQVTAHNRNRLAASVEINHDGVAARSLLRRFVDNLLTMVAAGF